MTILKRINFLLVLSVLVYAVSLLAPDTASAKGGATVKFPVVTIKPGDDAQVPQPNTFVNMYEIKLVNNQYVGKLISTLSTGKKGKSAIFYVKPGKVVHFLGFSDKALALATTKYSLFTTPPFKNFSNNDGVKGQLCLTDGIYFDKKLGTTLNDESALNMACTKKGAVVDLTNANVVKYPVIIVNQNDNDQKAIPQAYINMYEIKAVDNIYTGKLISTLPTGKNGTAAVFKVKPGQVVHFLGFQTKAQAKKAITYSPFTTPPYKNFSVDDGVLGQLCYTDGIYFDKKLGQSQGDAQLLNISCSKGPAAVYMADMESDAVSSEKTSLNLEELKKQYTNDNIAPEVTSIEGKSQFVSKVNYDYGTKVTATATDDSGYIASMTLYSYNKDNPSIWPMECGPMISPATCEKQWAMYDFGATYVYYAEVVDMNGNKTTSEKKYFTTPAK